MRMSETAGIHWPAFLRRAVVAVALVALDLWSKAAVFAWLTPRPDGVGAYDTHGHWRHTLLGEWLGFYLIRNPGMAWGFDKLPPWLLVGGRAIAVLFLLWLVATTPRTRRVLAWSLTLILAGAVGNLYDNLFLAPPEGRSFGEVRDFIDVYFSTFDWHFPTFNIADACISVGAVLLLGASLFTREADAASAAVDGASSDTRTGPAA